MLPFTCPPLAEPFHVKQRPAEGSARPQRGEGRTALWPLAHVPRSAPASDVCRSRTSRPTPRLSRLTPPPLASRRCQIFPLTSSAPRSRAPSIPTPRAPRPTPRVSRLASRVSRLASHFRRLAPGAWRLAPGGWRLASGGASLWSSAPGSGVRGRVPAVWCLASHPPHAPHHESRAPASRVSRLASRVSLLASGIWHLASGGEPAVQRPGVQGPRARCLASGGARLASECAVLQSEGRPARGLAVSRRAACTLTPSRGPGACARSWPAPVQCC